jgi:hypothetical protein
MCRKCADILAWLLSRARLPSHNDDLSFSADLPKTANQPTAHIKPLPGGASEADAISKARLQNLNVRRLTPISLESRPSAVVPQTDYCTTPDRAAFERADQESAAPGAPIVTTTAYAAIASATWLKLRASSGFAGADIISNPASTTWSHEPLVASLDVLLWLR